MNLCVYRNQSIVYKYLRVNIVVRLIINKAVKNHVNGKTINVNLQDVKRQMNLEYFLN